MILISTLISEMHPGVVNITLGRQLLAVDSFLIERASQLETVFHTATWRDDGTLIRSHDPPLEHYYARAPVGRWLVVGGA